MARQEEQALANQLFGGPQQQSMGALEAAREGVKEFLNGMFPGLKDAGQEIKTELKQMAAHGAHELAAALFNGNGFVMYPRGTREDHADRGPEQAQAQGQEAPAQQQQQERGGREM
jgi:hypothetical protein